MRRHDATHWRIAADPVGYHYRWQDSQNALQGNRRSAINSALVCQHGLIFPDAAPLDAVAQRLVAGWAGVGTAAALVAMAKQSRSATAHRDFLSALPEHRHFMKLGFAQATVLAATPMGRSDLRAWGAGYLIAGLAPTLPRWLAQRLALPFESITDVPDVSPANFDHPCFWSALRHAQTIAPAC